MIFKNLNIFRVSGSFDSNQLANFLSKNSFQQTLPNQEKSVGFGKVFGMDKYMFSSGAVHLFCLLIEERILPPSVVKSAFKGVLKTKEESEKRKIKGDEKKALRETVRNSLIPKAFCRVSEVWSYIDTKSNILVVNSSSPKVADGIAQTLSNIHASCKIVPLMVQDNIVEALSLWVKLGKAPHPFKIGSKCEIFDGEGAIKYRNRSLEDKHLRDYLHSDLNVVSIALDAGSRSSFILNYDLMIREFSLDGSVIEQELANVDGPLGEIDKTLVLMSNEIRVLVGDLLSALGGELNQ